MTLEEDGVAMFPDAPTERGVNHTEELEAVAEDAEGREIMAVRHRKYPVYGLQFHPESIMTPEGSKILENFLEIA